MARNRLQIAQERGWDVAEVYKAIDAWRALYKRKPGSSITLDEYMDLMQASGLRPNMIGLTRGKYSLARTEDSGDYTLGNVRFLPIEENVAERKEGYQSKPEFRAAMSAIALQRVRIECCHCGKKVTSGMHARWHGEKCKQKILQGAHT